MRSILTLLLALCVCLDAGAQAFTPRRPFIPTVAASGPAPIPGLYLHWDASDLNGNLSYTNQVTAGSQIQYWKDEIIGAVLTNSSAVMPTWNGCGVYFNGSSWLTNAISGFSNVASSFMFIMKLDSSPPANQFVHDTIDGARGSQISSGAWTYYDVGSVTLGNNLASPETNLFTMIFSGGGYLSYTNGVLAVDNSGSAAPIPPPSDWQVVGTYGPSTAAQPLHGTIYEIYVWTNKPTISASAASNLNWVAVQKWGGCVTNPFPQNVPGLALYWVASDTFSQGTNTALTNWIDRIQGSIWTNGASAQRPTNALDGVHFAGAGIHFTNAGASLTGSSGVVSNTHWIVWRIKSTAGLWDDLALMGSSGGAPTISTRCFSPDYISNGRWQTGANPTPAFVPNLETNIENEFLVRWRDTVYDAYTNALNVVTNQGGNNSINNGNIWTNLGDYGAVTFGQSTYTIKEIAIWTNVLSDVTISNLHWYRTNTYPAP